MRTRVAVAGWPGCVYSLIPRFWTIYSWYLSDDLFFGIDSLRNIAFVGLFHVRLWRLRRARNSAGSAR
jgi:hypothetical protein